jgi:hypothetical protein
MKAKNNPTRYRKGYAVTEVFTASFAPAKKRAPKLYGWFNYKAKPSACISINPASL